jgi:hypothetical protein
VAQGVGLEFKPQHHKKKKKKLRAGGVTQVVECLPSKGESEFKPSTTEKRKYKFE